MKGGKNFEGASRFLIKVIGHTYITMVIGTKKKYSEYWKCKKATLTNFLKLLLFKYITYSLQLVVRKYLGEIIEKEVGEYLAAVRIPGNTTAATLSFAFSTCVTMRQEPHLSCHSRHNGSVIFLQSRNLEENTLH